MSKKKTKDDLITELLLEGVAFQIKKNNFNPNIKIQSAKMGRPTKINPEIVQTIETETLQNPRIGGIALSNKIATSLGVSLSYTTINKIRNEIHFSFKIQRRRSFLTETRIQNRIVFCNGQLQGQIDWQNCVVFSDESRFCLHDDSRRVWVKRGVYNDGTFINEKKYNQGIMVWGAIGKGWRSPLVLVKGKLNTEGYMNLLSENEIFTSLDDFYGQKKYFFEQDGAPSHRAKKNSELDYQSKCSNY